MELLQKNPTLRIMKNIFHNICLEHNSTRSCDKLYGQILEQYHTIPRYYHTFDEHIAFCIKELISLPAHMIHNFHAAFIALLTHDAYHLHGEDAHNVTFARTVCTSMNVKQQLIKDVCGIVEALSHTIQPQTHDERVCVDIDLAILGQETKIFDQYEMNIRKEYPSILDAVFVFERAKIMRRFLDRPSIYHTDHFKNKNEILARKNLTRFVTLLAN